MMLLNLLPWRQKRRQQRVRRWSLLFTLVPAIALMLVVCGKSYLAWQRLQQQAQREYLAITQTALQQRLKQRLALQEQYEKWQRSQQIRHAQQQAIRHWEARLIALAELLPAGAWFTSLSQQKEHVVVQGHSRAPGDMQQLENGLSLLEGVSSVQAGGVKEDSQGGFGFVFNLTLTEVAHAVAD